MLMSLVDTWASTCRSTTFIKVGGLPPADRETLMSDDSGMTAAEPQMWWTNGHWTAIPPDLLSPGTSNAMLALNILEFPDLARLVQFAGDVDGYLASLGIDDDAAAAHADDSDSQNEGEADVGAGMDA